mgnify:CR=1 FL=1
MPKYKVSIVGDSISTYEGFNPYGYPVYYKEDMAYDNEINSVGRQDFVLLATSPSATYHTRF